MCGSTGEAYSMNLEDVERTSPTVCAGHFFSNLLSFSFY